ncbi:hypothetical protein LTR04_007357 [Oleoguttula sp. CCFEE 6159]|nr:hypothetical protein LTR04_007357 [Oleoguttula sp. CCFEE 6159]
MATNKEKTNGQTPSAITFGLNVMQKRPEEASPEDESTGDRNGATEQQVAASHSSTTTTDDQRAFAALTGEKPHSTRVVSAINEDEAFRRDYDSTPDMATLAEYEAMPIEEFGAALLRGMGWKDGDPIGKRKGQQAAKPRLLERRPALLGIGAKEEAAVGVELGAWGKGAKGGRRDQPYTPVILKNAKTGEQLTEEELKAKLEQQKMVESTEAVQKRNLSERDSDRREKRRRTAGTNGDTIVDGTTETIGVVIRTIATMTNAVPLIVATAILTGITNLVVTGDDGRKHASPAWYIAGDLF